MIESSAEPVCSGVAGVASGGITRGDVVGDRTTESLRAVPIGEMATVASGVGRGEVVIVVEVARGAGSVHVRAGQSPASSGVVEHAGIPGHGVMASGTERSGKARSDVIGHGTAKRLGAVPGRLVAAIAIGVSRSEVVIIVDVTKGTGGGEMRTGQSEARRRMIEGRDVSPGDGVVARGAIRCSESRAGGGVSWIVGLLPG